MPAIAAPGERAEPARRPVADARDVRLVAHQPVEHELRPRGDLARQRRRRLRRVHRRALGADPHPAAERPPARVDVEADPHRRVRGRARRRGSASRCSTRVDHHRDPLARGAARELAQRRAGRRSGRRRRRRRGRAPASHSASGSVKARMPCRPAPSARSISARHAHGLRRQPDRLAARAAQQVGGVGVEGVEVDDRERRVQAGGRGVEPLAFGLWELRHGPGRYPPGLPLECRASKRDITPSPIRPGGRMGAGEPKQCGPGKPGPGANRRDQRRSASLSARARQLTP